MEKIKYSRRSIFKIIQLIISVSLLLYLYIKYNISFQNSFSSIKEPQYLIISVLISVFAVQLLAVFRWNLILSGTKIKEKFSILLRINLLSIFWGIFLPSTNGSVAIRIYKLEKRHPDKPAVAGSTVILEKLTGAIMLCFLALTGSFLIPELDNEILVRSIILLTILLFSALFILISSPKKIISSYSEKKIINLVINYINNLKSSFHKIAVRQILYKLIPTVILFHLLTIFIINLIFRAMSLHISFLEHLTLVPMIFLFSLIPITFSGFGVRESLYVLFYQRLGIDPEISFAISILQFIILMGMPALLGGLISIISQINRNFLKGREIK